MLLKRRGCAPGLEIRKFSNRSTFKLLAGPPNRSISSLTGPQIVNKTWEIRKIFFFHLSDWASVIQSSQLTHWEITLKLMECSLWGHSLKMDICPYQNRRKHMHIMNAMKLVIPIHFISWVNKFSDISRMCILPGMIRVVNRPNHIW